MRCTLTLQKATALLLAFCLLQCFALPAAAETVAAAPLSIQSGAQNGMVRVYLSSLGQPSQVDVTICGSYSLDGTGATALQNGSTVRVDFNASTGQLTLNRNGVSTAMGTDFRLRRHETSGDNGVKIRQARVSGNLYPGDLQFKSALSGGKYRLYVIAHVFIEDYLYGVLPYEMGNSSALEALKAQCVSARTYTLRAMQAASARSYDLVDTTNDQVYNGTPAGNARCRQAVDETRGIVAMNNGAFTATYYTASNGGQIESVRNIWGFTGYDYIRVKEDPYDYQNPYAEVRTFTVSGEGAQRSATLQNLLITKAAQVFGTPDVTLLAVTDVTPHTPRYAAPSRLYTKMDFSVRVSAGGQTREGKLTFDIFSELEKPLGMSINADQNELWTVIRTSGGFTVQARRFGHGTGLSQRGAMRMGELGYTYDQILGFYFEGCQRVQHSFVRSILSPVTSGASQEQLSADTPASIPASGSGSGVVQAAGAAGEVALRVAASSAADIITGLPHGAAVSVHALVNGWYLISYGVLCGYVQQDGLKVNGNPDGQGKAATILTAYGTVTNTNYLNLREGPGMNTTVIGTVPAGTVLPLISISGDWAYTQHGAQPGFVSMSFISRSERYGGSAADGNASGAEVIADGAGMYLSPSTSGAPYQAVPRGAVVKVKSDDGSWSQVYYAGVTGYMLSAVLRKNGMVVEEIPDAPRPGEQYATVDAAAGTLNMRAAAGMSSGVLLVIPGGETLIVEQNSGEWCRVRYHGVTGYCMTRYLQLGVNGSAGTDTQQKAVVVTDEGPLNLRKSDSAQAAVLTTIPRGATIDVLSRGVTWCKVTYGGFIGYAMTRYLRFDDAVSVPTPTPYPGAVPVIPVIPVATVSPVPTAAPVQGGTALPASARVTTPSGSLNLRKTASASAKVIGHIPQYAVVPVVGISGTWTEVAYDGAIGYVMSAFLTYLTDGQATAVPVSALPTPSPVESETTYAKVTTASGSLNLRKSASASASVRAHIPQGEMIRVLERLGTWAKVVYQDQTGYVMTAFLTFVEVPAPAQPRPTENVSGTVVTAQVTTEKGSLNLRERASSGARVLAAIPQYAWVSVLSRGGQWSQVTYGSRTGYVRSEFLTFSAAQAAAPTPAPVPVTGSGEPYAQVVTADGSLNLRKSASSGAKVLHTIPQSAIVNVLAKGTVWTQVNHGGETGYVKTEYLSFLQSVPAGSAAAAAGGTIAALSAPLSVRVSAPEGSVLMRVEPDAASAPLAIIARGEYVLATARSAVWCRVEYEGLAGYLPAASLELP